MTYLNLHSLVLISKNVFSCAEQSDDVDGIGMESEEVDDPSIAQSPISVTPGLLTQNMTQLDMQQQQPAQTSDPVR